MKPDFQLTAANARVIADICQRLDGLPLAIELAAARSKLLPPHALLSRLDHRLDVLTHAPSDLPARHHSLRRTLAWSYDLLTPEEQQLFRRLSVFVGGCTLEAAESVYKAFGERTDALAFSVLDGVTSLIDKSLLHQKGQEEPRLVLLETIREYGQECLLSCGEAPLAQRAHADYYLALAQRAESKLMGIEQKSWFERLEQEYENLWTALEWLEEQNEIEKALQLGSALWRFWWARGYLNQGSTTLERLLRASRGASTPVRAKALTVAGLLIDAQGDAGRAEELCKESLHLYRALGDVQGISSSLAILGSAAAIRSDYVAARALLEEGLALGRSVRDSLSVTTTLAMLALVAIQQGEYVEARSVIEESLKLTRQAGDTWGIARALFLLAMVLLAHGDYAGADRPLEESLILSRTVGDKRGIAYASLWLGVALFFQGRYPSARSFIEESLHLLMEAGDRRGIAQGLYALAGLTLLEGDPVEARTLYEESLALLRKINYPSFIPACLEGLAMAILAQGDPAWAARLWGKAESTREAIGVPNSVLMHTLHKQAVAAARVQLGEETFATMWGKGRMMTLEQVLAGQSQELPTLNSNRHR
jgi:tetratricopeptide (TPR) repeat protein